MPRVQRDGDVRELHEFVETDRQLVAARAADDRVAAVPEMWGGGPVLHRSRGGEAEEGTTATGDRAEGRRNGGGVRAALPMDTRTPSANPA